MIKQLESLDTQNHDIFSLFCFLIYFECFNRLLFGFLNVLTLVLMLLFCCLFSLVFLSLVFSLSLSLSL